MYISYMHKLLKNICKMVFKTNYVNKLFFYKIVHTSCIEKLYIKFWNQIRI
jgi:hypothetical protein